MCKVSPLNVKLLKRHKKIKNDLTSDLRSAKCAYYKEICDNANNIWTVLNKEMGRHDIKSRNKVPNSVKLIDYPNMVSGDENISNAMNNYFVYVGEKLAAKFDKEYAFTDRLPTFQNIADFSFAQITESEVMKEIETLNAKKAMGLDEISLKVIKFCKNEIAMPLTLVINKSLEQQTFPSALKYAKILPIHKKGPVNEVSNYRPISILPGFSKVIEKLINSQLLNHLETNNLLSPQQYGFRKSRSTTDAVIEFKNNTLKAFNDGKCVIGIFIDFSKAFDTINHKILFTKLKALGFSQSVILWIQNYLLDRTQSTVINYSLSSSQTFNCGVPQGSVLGPTLFLIYINDLSNKLKYLNPIFYADDTNLFYESKDLNADIDLINSDLNVLNEWCTENRLTINFEKCNFIILKNPQNKLNFQKESISLGDVKLKFSTEIKFLGTILDSQLNWKDHISNLLKQLRPISGCIYRLSHLPIKILILIYHSFIHSKLNYCIEAWGNAPNIYLSKLINFQKKILRIIYKKPFDYPTSNLFKISKILNIHQIYKFYYEHIHIFILCQIFQP